MAEVDLAQIANLLGVAGSSTYDGEAVNAIRLVDRRLRAANMRWPDLVAPFRQLEIAVDAAQSLLAEIDELRAEVERLRAVEASLGTTVWHEVGAQVTNTSSAARWALDLYGQDAVWLSPFEVSFLQTCSRWVGKLTQNQQPIFQQIMDRVVDRTGLVPPS